MKEMLNAKKSVNQILVQKVYVNKATSRTYVEIIKGTKRKEEIPNQLNRMHVPTSRSKSKQIQLITTKVHVICLIEQHHISYANPEIINILKFLNFSNSFLY